MVDNEDMFARHTQIIEEIQLSAATLRKHLQRPETKVQITEQTLDKLPQALARYLNYPVAVHEISRKPKSPIVTFTYYNAENLEDDLTIALPIETLIKYME